MTDTLGTTGPETPADPDRSAAAALSSCVDVLVVGGGISGLATAHFLRRDLRPDATVLVLEADRRPGGKIWTRSVADLPVDVGPDAFLARAPELKELVSALGLADLVTGPTSSGAYVWSRGRMRRLPGGAMFGIPDRILPMLGSGLLSPWGAVRAGVDLVRPVTTPSTPDPSVGDLVRPRFGAEVFDRLVQPLLGGVHAGDADQLSARSSVPEVAAMARSGRSLFLTLRTRRRAVAAAASAASASSGTAAKPAPALVSLRGGMVGLVDALVASLGPDLRTGVTVHGIEELPEGILLTTSAGNVLASQVVLATPAYRTADLLDAPLPAASAVLREIPYVDVANVTLAFPLASLTTPVPDGTGFLVPPVEGELIVGCSWLTSKWPHLASDEVVLIRAMVGRAGDRRWLTMSDDEIAAAVRDSLSRLMDVSGDPVEVLVQRWPAAMPQYTVGHADRLARLDAVLTSLPRLHVTGAAYRGVGLAGCVAQAASTARTITDHLDVVELGSHQPVTQEEGAAR